MKKLLLLVFAAVTVVCASVSAQEIPKGSYALEPYIEQSRTGAYLVVRINVEFSEADFMAEFDQAGKTTNMWLRVNRPFGEPGEPIAIYEFPWDKKDFSGIPLINVVAWKEFAAKLRQRCSVVDSDLFIDTEAWDYLGLALQYEGHEPAPHLVFRASGGLKVIKIGSWKSNSLPKEKTRVLIGKWQVENFFFPVRSVDGKYLIEPAAMKAITEAQKEAVLYAEQFKKEISVEKQKAETK